MRYRPFILLTAVAVVALILYYIDWRSTASPRVQAAAPAGAPAPAPAPAQRPRIERPTTVTGISQADLDELAGRRLVLPLDGLKASDILDTFAAARSGGRRHEASDILAPHGTPIHAMGPGDIRKLFTSQQGGITIYQFDPEEVWCYYYAHLDRYADDLHEGQRVKAGDVIGYVGTTGNAPAGTPHLHLAIFKIGPEKHWWGGTAVNPYPVLIDILKR
ncbi:MAG: M23 family metallopeptidase [Acidobacteriota bacterium]|nr:M23 family metallopeptidase [Acidobacteriota bacterium]